MLADSIFSLDSTAPISRRHHYVPKFLLSHFTVDGVLWATDVASGRQWQTSPDGTGFENDYNTVPSSKVRQDAGELMLADLDQIAAPVITDVLKYGIPYGDTQQMEILLGFVATQLVRVPAWRADRDGFIDELSYHVLDLSSATEERWEEQARQAKAAGVREVLTFQQVRNIVEKRSLRFRWNNAAQLTHNADLAAKLVPVLSQRNWYLGWSESGGLVCGDSAVTLVNTCEVGGYWSSPGFAVPFTEVALPLSRHWVLLGRFERVASAVVRLNRPRVAELNNRALWHAERLGWSGVKDFPWIDDTGDIRVGADCLAEAFGRMKARSARRG